MLGKSPEVIFYNADNEEPGDEDDLEGGEENDTEDDDGEDQIVSNYRWLDTGLVAWRDTINYWSLCDNITFYNRPRQQFSSSPDWYQHDV